MLLTVSGAGGAVEVKSLDISKVSQQEPSGPTPYLSPGRRVGNEARPLPPPGAPTLLHLLPLQTQPHLMAVGCGDPYVRLYDRRMLSPSAPPTRAAGGKALGQTLAKLAPAHLVCGESRWDLGR